MHRMWRKHRQNSNRLYLVLPIVVLSVIGGGGIFGYDFYDRQGRFISSRDSRQAWYKMADKIAEAKLKEAKRQILEFDFAGGLKKQKKSVNKPLCRARDPCMQVGSDILQFPVNQSLICRQSMPRRVFVTRQMPIQISTRSRGRSPTLNVDSQQTDAPPYSPWEKHNSLFFMEGKG